MRRVAVAIGALCVALPLTAPAGAAPVPAWVPTLPLPPFSVVAVSAFEGGTAFLSVRRTTPAMFARSGDGGRTWTTLPDPPENGMSRFATPALGYSAGRSSLYVSRDGARSWSRTAPLQSDGGAPLADTFGVARGTRTVVVAGQSRPRSRLGCNPERGAIWSSADAGRSWRRAVLGAGRQPYHVRPYDSRHALALVRHVTRPAVDSNCIPALVDSSLWLTKDGGRTWRQVLTCRLRCSTAVIVRPGQVLVGRTDGTTTRSDDGGRTWREGQRLVERELGGAPAAGEYLGVGAFGFGTSTVGYASTNGGGTWRTADGGRTWQPETSSDRVATNYVDADLAAVGRDHAILVGPHAVTVRVPPG